MKVPVIPIVIGVLAVVFKGLVMGLEDSEMSTSGDLPNCSILKIGQNTEKCPGYLRRFAVTQTPLRNHQQKLARKTLKGVNNVIYNNIISIH